MMRCLSRLRYSDRVGSHTAIAASDRRNRWTGQDNGNCSRWYRRHTCHRLNTSCNKTHRQHNTQLETQLINNFRAANSLYRAGYKVGEIVPPSYFSIGYVILYLNVCLFFCFQTPPKRRVVRRRNLARRRVTTTWRTSVGFCVYRGRRYQKNDILSKIPQCKQTLCSADGRSARLAG